MEKPCRVFLVRTDWWYIERLVWLIAGIDVTGSSLLTAAHHPNWAFSIFFVGMCSILVALTGFCFIGNILYVFGVKPLVPSARVCYNSNRPRIYCMQTDAWFLERRIYLFVGINLSVSSMLARFQSISWLFFTGFVGIATICFALTGFCIMANLLYRLGAEPRMRRPA